MSKRFKYPVLYRSLFILTLLFFIFLNTETKAKAETFGKSYYVVRPDDTLDKIVKTIKGISDQNKSDHISLYPTVENLKKWNAITTDQELITKEVISLDGINDYGNYRKESINFNGNSTDMINYIADYAVKYGQTHGVYPSVILGQSLHETGVGTSDKARLANNYFGIKGTYKGHSVFSVTWEEDSSGNITYLVDQFRLYPTIEESVLDYANRVKSGPATDSELPSWNPVHYSKALVMNNDSYIEAVQALKDAGYASDSKYVSLVNTKILDHGLFNYDNQTIKMKSPEKIISINEVAYKGKVINNYPILSTYAYETGFEVRGYLSNNLGSEVTVKAEVKTDKNIWLNISLDGYDLGWVVSKAISPIYSNLLEERIVAYNASLNGDGNNIYSEPSWSANNKLVRKSVELAGQNVVIISERIMDNGSYVKIRLNGQDLGWVNKAGITAKYTPVIKEKFVAYKAVINGDGNNIYSEPSWTANNHLVAYSSAYKGQLISVLSEKVTDQGSYVLVNISGVTIGWLNKAGITPSYSTVTKDKTVAYNAAIRGDGNNIYTQPAWSSDGELAYLSNSYSGTAIVVTKEKVTDIGTFSLVTVNGKALGWINKAGLELKHAAILDTKTVAYKAIIKGDGNNMYSQPAWSNGNELVKISRDFAGQEAVITSEIQTELGYYAYVNVNGVALGWINFAGITPRYSTILKKDIVAYNATIKGDGNNIYSQPAWSANSFLVARASNYGGQNIVVTSEIQTELGTYALVKIGSQQIGWINKVGLSPLYATTLSTNKVNYDATIVNTGSNIFSKPAWTQGSKLAQYSTNYFNVKLKAIQEARTQNGDYVLLSHSGVELGWIHKSSVKESSRVVFIDVGHGGSDPGAQYYGVNEKDLNLKISMKLKRELEAEGFSVIMSRTTDIHIDYKTERSRIANNSGADIFVSVHNNAMPGNSYVNGIETFYYEYDPQYQPKINEDMHNNPDRLLKSASLANAIHKNLITDTGAYNRGVRRDTFAVLRETSLPAVLLELGFMSNLAELNKLSTDAYQEKLAKSISSGIVDYFRTY